MKYIITETQLDKIYFNYLDSMFKDLYTVDDRDNILIWLNKESWTNSHRPIFSYYVKTKELGISAKLIMEISSFFSLDPIDSTLKLTNWFEKNFELPVDEPYVM
jgi:hypothetical protein